MSSVLVVSWSGSCGPELRDLDGHWQVVRLGELALSMQHQRPQRPRHSHSMLSRPRFTLANSEFFAEQVPGLHLALSFDLDRAHVFEVKLL